ncbi:MAG: hypothetical protein PHD37_07980 [Gallionellaceae bacterium]|nr:hypothetical protein [Gallionellaceae bacterium]
MNIIKQSLYMAVLGIVLAALFLPPNLIGLGIFDEGFIASGAMLVKDGKLPYRDFLSMYGPGQYYLTAAIYSMLGESLVFVHYLHVIVLTALGVTIYALAKRTSTGVGGPLLLLLGYAGIVLFAQPNVGYPAVTATVFLLFSALALGGCVDTFRTNRLVPASCLIGMAGLFRWDFGVFGLLAIALTLTMVVMQERRNAAGSTSILSWFIAALAPAIFIMAAIYVPFVILFSDPVRWLQEGPLFSLMEFSKWRNLEYVRPALWALLKSSSPLTFETSILKLAYLGIPVVLVIGSIGTAAYYFARPPENKSDRNRLVMLVYLAFLCLFLLNQMRVRPTLWQGFPAMAASLPLIALLLEYYKTIISRSKPLAVALNVTGFIIGALLFNTGLNRLFESSDKHLIALNTPRSSGIRVDPEMKLYVDMIKYVMDNTKPGEAIYSGVRDHSRLVYNDAMLYFLTDRPPADRFLELEPGISNTRKAQEEIINSIKQKNVRLIVLSDILSDEPNNTSRSNGVSILDEFIRNNYHFDRSFEGRLVFVKN